MDAPLVLLPDVVSLAQVNEVCDRFSGKEHETIDDFDLKRNKVSYEHQRLGTRSEGPSSHWHFGALLPPRRAGFSSKCALCHRQEELEEDTCL